VIKVFSFMPEFFNNNGDQGNLEALAYFTRAEIIHADIEKADLVLFGDASRAAMRKFETELLSHVAEIEARLASGAPTLLIGSSFEYFATRVKGMPALRYGERVSEFRTVEAWGLSVRGYRNSELVSPDVFASGNFVGTTLFGPVLAKNPALLESFAKALGLEVQMSADQRFWIEQI
jgi:CobQ-like glutamine amidotransferase family enzyme